jgi:hypothetical protein
MKHFEISIKKDRSEIILARDTDTPDAWWRENVSQNRNGRVTLNGASYSSRHLISVKEVRSSMVTFPDSLISEVTDSCDLNTKAASVALLSSAAIAPRKRRPFTGDQVR